MFHKCRHIFLLQLLSFIILAVPCIANAKINGVVKDLFGNGIKDVTIQIENTGFTATTDKKGRYSIGYVSGKLKLKFSKEKYTTKYLELDIYTEAKFPAAPIEMWPIPSPGIYIIDRIGKKYIPITQAFKIKEQNRRGQNGRNDIIGHVKHGYWATNHGELRIPVGEVEIVDTYPKLIVLYKKNKDNLFLNIKTGMMGVIEGYFFNGEVSEKSDHIGEEKLLVRRFTADSGFYLFVESKKINDGLGHKYTVPTGNYFPLIIGDPKISNTPAKPTTSPKNPVVTKEQTPESVSAPIIEDTAIDINSKYYTTENPFYLSGYGGQCTAFAWGRAYEKTGIKIEISGIGKYPSAKYWYLNKPAESLSLEMGKTPQPNSIAVWEGDKNNPHGHVAFVERIDGETVYYNEANVSNFSVAGGGYHGKEENMSIAQFESRGTGIGPLLGYIYLAHKPSKAISKTSPEKSIVKAEKQQPPKKKEKEMSLEEAIEKDVRNAVDTIFSLFK